MDDSERATGAPVGSGSNDDRGETIENPVYEPVLADPSLVRAPDGTFYAFGTEDASPDWDDCSETAPVPIVASDDLVDWEYVGNAFSERPDWKDDGFVWAPDINYYDGRYVLYYAFSEWGDANPGIGVATSDTPTGPYEDHGCLFDSESIGVDNSIDPHFHVDDGTPYLVWGSFNGIYLLELTADGLDYRPETKTLLAGDAYEAPWIVERQGQYVLFLSTGLCCEGLDSTYAVEVATADSLTGPYYDVDGTDVREYDEHNAGTAALASTDELVGPGHNAVVTDDGGTDWIVYHAYDADVGGYVCDEFPRRAMAIDRIVYEDGAVDVADGAPNRTVEAPAVYRTRGGPDATFDLAGWRAGFGIDAGPEAAVVFHSDAVGDAATVSATVDAPDDGGTVGLLVSGDLADASETGDLSLALSDGTATLSRGDGTVATVALDATGGPQRLRLQKDGGTVSAAVGTDNDDLSPVGSVEVDAAGPVDVGTFARDATVAVSAFDVRADAADRD